MHPRARPARRACRLARVCPTRRLQRAAVGDLRGAAGLGARPAPDFELDIHAALQGIVNAASLGGVLHGRSQPIGKYLFA